MGLGLAFGLFIVVLIGLWIVGIVYLLRPRRPTFPSCGRCRYNVTSTIGESPRCPECGSLFAEVGITPPRRTRAGWRVAVAVCMAFVLLAAIAMSALGLVAVASARQAVVTARTTAAQRGAQPLPPGPVDPSAPVTGPSAVAPPLEDAGTGSVSGDSDDGGRDAGGGSRESSGPAADDDATLESSDPV